MIVKERKDIENRGDIELMVNSFYNSVQSNNKLGYIFKDIAMVKWDVHLPKMYAFWSHILLGDSEYKGNPMIKHIALSKQAPMTDEEFSEWLALFIYTVDQLFQGPVAEEAKLRAANIARLMLHKIKLNEQISF